MWTALSLAGLHAVKLAPRQLKRVSFDSFLND
jgi:hypothetical protein